jgi:hypothetical protein
MNSQTKDSTRKTIEGLGKLSEELLIEIHHQVDQNKRADEIQVDKKRILGKEGENTILRLGYKSFETSFQNGEYECTAVIDGKNRLVEVRDVKDLY